LLGFISNRSIPDIPSFDDWTDARATHLERLRNRRAHQLPNLPQPLIPPKPQPVQRLREPVQPIPFIRPSTCRCVTPASHAYCAARLLLAAGVERVGGDTAARGRQLQPAHVWQH